MRIRILSDLHREFGSTPIPHVEADVILMAGDIGVKLNSLPWIQEFCGDTPVAYVCGNHEYYGDRLPRVREKLQAATTGTGVHVLEDDWFTVCGWHIYGYTLWTDFALLEEWSEGAALAGEIMNDYKRIRNSSRHYRKLSPSDTRLLHVQSVRKLDEFLGSHNPARTIVVTHHAPSRLSLPDGRRRQSISCAYASNLDWC